MNGRDPGHDEEIGPRCYDEFNQARGPGFRPFRNRLTGSQADSERHSSPTFVVTNAGQHTIVVSDEGGDAAGTVGLSLQRTRNLGLATQLQYGESTAVSIPMAHFQGVVSAANFNGKIFERSAVSRTY